MPAPSRAPVSFQRSVTETPWCQSHFWRTAFQSVARRMFRRRFRFRRQGKMSSKFKAITGTVAIAALLSLCAPVFAQSDDGDPEMRIERLENQLRQLTGQNEELQYRNRQLEDRIRQLEGGAQGRRPARLPTSRPCRPLRSRRPIASSLRSSRPRSRITSSRRSLSPAPIVQEQPGPGAPGTRRRGDAFDPSQTPNAPGAPRALGGGQQPMSAGTSAAQGGAPGGRGAGEPLDLNNNGGRYPQAQYRPSPAIRRRNRALPRRLVVRLSRPCRPRRRRATSSTSASATCSARTMRSPSRP